MAVDLERLQEFRISDVPPTLYYIPNFITEDEEHYIIQQVDAAPKPKWTQLSNRRLQNWGGLPHPKGMVSEPLPVWLETCAKKIAALGPFEDKMPNHVLVNEYQPGQGIMPHEDGPLYYPTVSNLTLASHTVLDLYRPLPSSNGEGEMETPKTSFEERYMGGMLLQRRSLFLMREDMYKIYLHGIQERTSDTVSDKLVNLDRCSGVEIDDHLERSRRISLTIRHVPNVLKTKIFFGRKR